MSNASSLWKKVREILNDRYCVPYYFNEVSIYESDVKIKKPDKPQIICISFQFKDVTFNFDNSIFQKYNRYKNLLMNRCSFYKKYTCLNYCDNIQLQEKNVHQWREYVDTIMIYVLSKDSEMYICIHIYNICFKKVNSLYII